MATRTGWRWRRTAVRYTGPGAPEYYPYRRRLLAGLRGTVLELGPGGGANMSHYAKRVDWIGLEPNGYFTEPLRRATRGRGHLLTGEAERIPLADDSVDVVVATLVLCSVRDQRRVLAEITRVLRPGGRYVFLEHVLAAPYTWSRFMLRVAAPGSRFFDGGCDPARQTGRRIEAAFEHVEVEQFTVAGPLGVGIPHLAGWAESARD